MADTTHETTAQKQERLKKLQNPWEELPRLFSSFRSGFYSMSPVDRDMRLRWWGLYTQGDGGGAFGEMAPYFMMRVRTPNGLLSSQQMRTVAYISRRYGRGLADITTRQNFQLHWLEAEELPDIMNRLEAAGLTTKSACGDDPRNVTGCPLAGVDPEELFDASPYALAINQALIADNALVNLPRKFKVSVSGCRQWCVNPEINDVALTAREFNGELGFALRVGGGLSNAPFIAQALPVFIKQNQVVEVARAMGLLFRDTGILRENRGKARLKFVFIEYKWTVERFRQELEAKLGYKLQDAAPDAPPKPEFRDHVGVHAQKQAGQFYIGASVLRGRLNADQVEEVADIAESLAGGQVRLTGMQNLVITGVPQANVSLVQRALERAGLPIQGSAFRRGTMSCTGKEFCKLSITDTKNFAAELVRDLERRLPEFTEPLRINLNGCPNSCGQHWIADIGLQGTRVKTATGPADGFDVYLGGGLGEGAGIARKTLARVLGTELAPRIESLLRYYLQHRHEGDSFRDFVRREDPGVLAKVLGTLPLADVQAKQTAAEPALQ